MAGNRESGDTQSGPATLDTSATFDALGHETRLAIVEALADGRREGWQPKGYSFAELRRKVDVRDAGQFNYHLDKLLGSFVYQQDGEYVLTNAGFELAGAIRAGRFAGAASGERRRGTLERTCVACDSQLEAIYEYGHLRVECPDHDVIYRAILPPAAIRDREMEHVVELAVERSRYDIERARNGTCPHCWGHMVGNAPPENPEKAVERRDGEPDGEVKQQLVAFECRDCGLHFFIPVAVCVAFHPAVVSYYHRRGVDVTDAGFLGLDHLTGANGRLVAEEPARIEVVVATADAAEGLVLTLDGDATVTAVEREADVTLPRPSTERSAADDSETGTP